MNQNRNIKIEKLTLNIGAGKEQAVLEKGVKLLEYITGITPVKTVTQKRIPTWGLRPGLPIGCKLTLRGKDKLDLIKRLLKAKSNQLKKNNFDKEGNISFGILEYIDVPGVKYNPDIGLTGFQVCITLCRNGFRVKNRKIMSCVIPHKHRITQDEAIEFVKKEFGVVVEEKEK
ncbi:50S ribosomal protein L5 [Candidatus Woesearchaeota archaeon]|nr:50S ribosomal protein L5 [Candidatus Woesearchaeota archaeon]